MTVDLREAHAPPSLSGHRIVEVPLVAASPASLEGFGHVVRAFAGAEVEIVPWPRPGWRSLDPGTGTGGGTVEGAFEVFRAGDVVCCRNHAVDGHYVTGWHGDPGAARRDVARGDRDCVYVREANYHPDGGQVFCPRGPEPFVSLLAPPGDGVRPQDFVAFYCDGSFGIHVDPGVWHQPVFPLADAVTFDTRQGAVHACITVDVVREFGAWLKVPLTAP